ncbi:MAG: hypothetical protein J1F20_05920 [Muribaculaceae bacterium]|nr:hypothetical protein [Muribaculaceae bacterium]
MSHFDYNPIAQFLTLKFCCPKCSNHEETEPFFVPTPDFAAETHRESVNSEFFKHICSKCNYEFDIELHNGYNGGSGEISGLGDNSFLDVVEEFEEYDNGWEYEYIEEHVRDIVKAIDAIEDLSQNIKSILYKNLYANLIGIMEAYLYETILHTVMSSENSKRRFVENFKDYTNTEISIANIYKNIDEIDTRIRHSLDNLLYHNLPKIKPLFKDTIDIDLGDISLLIKPINKRHHIIHRNGKNIQGEVVSVEKDELLNLVNIISNFIERIETQLHPHHPDLSDFLSEDAFGKLNEIDISV